MESINTGLKAAQPIKARTENILLIIKHFMSQKRCIKIFVTAKEIDISKTTTLNILHEKLRMKKLLTPKQKLCKKRFVEKMWSS